jgi:hypothetical protein
MAHAIAAGMSCRARLVRLPADLLRPIAALLGRARDFTRISSSLLVDTHEARTVLGWRAPFTIQEELAALGQAVSSAGNSRSQARPE